MVYSSMHYRRTVLPPALAPRKPFLFCSCKAPLPQPLYNLQLQTLLGSAHSKGLITPAESILTDRRSYNLFRINTYEKQGEGGPLPEFPSTLETLSRRCRGRAS